MFIFIAHFLCRVAAGFRLSAALFLYFVGVFHEAFSRFVILFCKN